MSESKVRYVINPDVIPEPELLSLIEKAGFGKASDYSPGLVSRMCKNAAFVSLAYTTNGVIVGYVRALSDDCMSTWIAEVAVLPEWQGRGIGRNLIEKVVERYGAHTFIYADVLAGQETFADVAGLKPRHAMTVCSRAQQANAA